jgi:hypothetical protein
MTVRACRVAGKALFTRHPGVIGQHGEAPHILFRVRNGIIEESGAIRLISSKSYP